MKKIYSLLLPMLALLLFSCSKDDPSDGDNTPLLAGDWELVEFTYDGVTTVKRGEMLDQSSYTGTAKNIDVQMKFGKLPSNTFQISGSYTLQVVSRVNGETQTTEEPYPNVSSSGSYTQEGEVLRLGYDSYQGALAIKEGSISSLTEGELVLEFEIRETSTVNGFEVELVVNGIQRFTR